MAVSKQKIVNWIEELAPKSLAEDWDNVGLQVGSLDGSVNRVCVTLTVDEGILKRAAESGAEFIISHHPLIFKPLKQINTSGRSKGVGRLISDALKAGLTVYSCHTNLDTAWGGISDALLDRLGLDYIGKASPVKVTYERHFVKLVVYVPVSHLEPVRQALAAAGAGWIGGYKDCAFWSVGKGVFRPLPGAKPYMGKVNELETADEARLETIIPEDEAGKCVKAMLKAHPYEEAAYDLFRLENHGISMGLGRVAELRDKVTLEEICRIVKSRLGCSHVRFSSDLSAPVKKVAVCGGAGAELISRCLRMGIDVLVTGDIKYHDALSAVESGIAVVDAGHHLTELPGMYALKDYLDGCASSEKIDVDIVVDAPAAEPMSIV